MADIDEKSYQIGYADGEKSAMADLYVLLFDDLELPEPEQEGQEYNTIRALVRRLQELKEKNNDLTASALENMKRIAELEKMLENRGVVFTK